MVKQSAGRQPLKFALVELLPSHLFEIAAWADIKSVREETTPDEEILRSRLYAAFRRHYRPLWHNGVVSSYVMTMNQRPVFCLSLLRIGRPGSVEPGDGMHLYFLCSPHIRRNARLLLLAWQAATTFVFLRLDIHRIQVAVDTDNLEENEALVTLGYRLIETSHEPAGVMHVYICAREGFKVVM